MVRCTHCGTDNPQESRYCQKCGKQVASATALATASSPIEVVTAVPVGAEYYILHRADQRKVGPLRPQDVATLVCGVQLSVHDDIQAAGGNG